MSMETTNGIPICPVCQKPTKRQAGVESSTCIYFTPTYDEEGNDITSGKNTTTTAYLCLRCNNWYQVSNGKYLYPYSKHELTP